MRCWLTILLVLFAAAAAQAGVETHSRLPVQTVGAVLSSGTEFPPHLADVPLYATAFSSVSSRLCGAETMPAKSRHSVSACVAWMRWGLYRCTDFSPRFSDNSDKMLSGCVRAADRYVYALRKIII